MASLQAGEGAGMHLAQWGAEGVVQGPLQPPPQGALPLVLAHVRPGPLSAPAALFRPVCSMHGSRGGERRVWLALRAAGAAADAAIYTISTILQNKEQEAASNSGELCVCPARRLSQSRGRAPAAAQPLPAAQPCVQPEEEQGRQGSAPVPASRSSSGDSAQSPSSSSA